MKNSKNIVSMFILLALSIIGVSGQAQRQPSRATDRQAGIILQRIEQGSVRFHNSLNAALAQGRNDINTFRPDFENATSQFRDQLTRRRVGAADVQNVLQKASLVNGFMARNRLNPRVQNDWASVRTDLNSLATAYGVSWQWARETLPTANPNRSSRLSNNERQGISDRVLARLESPEMLAIERRGSTITLASSRARQTTFEADGVEHQEQLSGGRSSRVTATLRGDQLGVSSTGYRGNDRFGLLSGPSISV